MQLAALLPEIEGAAVRGWPATVQIPFDGWLWRHSTGGSVRANSVAALAFTGTDPEAAIDAIEAAAEARSVRACFTVSDASVPSDLDARLAARGYARGDDHVTMAKWIASSATLPAGVALSAELSPGWMAVYLSGLSENRRATAPEILRRLPAAATYVSAFDGDSVISSGLTIGDGRVASVQCMASAPEARRRGGAQRVLQAIEAQAAKEGRLALYLQTSGDNAAARALYERMGFTVIGRYHTRTKN